MNWNHKLKLNAFVQTQNCDFLFLTNCSLQLCCHSWQDNKVTIPKVTHAHQQVLILDINSLIFKQDFQHVFVFWQHQHLDTKWEQTLHFPTFLEQTVNEVTNDKHGLTTTLVCCQSFQILLACQIQNESNRSSHTFVMTVGVLRWATEPGHADILHKISISSQCQASPWANCLETTASNFQPPGEATQAVTARGSQPSSHG